MFRKSANPSRRSPRPARFRPWRVRAAFRFPALVLAIPLFVLGSVTAAAYCGKSDRIGHRDSECVEAFWDNTDFIGMNYFHVRNACAAYGRVVAKIDLKGTGDRTWQIAGEDWRHGSSLHRVREISCCSDKSTLCNRSDVVTEGGCLARFAETSPAASSCIDATATPAIDGEDYGCTVSARCPRGTVFGQGPADYRRTSITVDYLDLGEVENCGGALRLGRCPSGPSTGREPVLSVADARPSGDPGEPLGFVVTLDGAASAAVVVDYATSDGTASADRDYGPATGSLVFARGETKKTVTVPVLEGGREEGVETLTLTLTLSNASGARIGDGEAAGTIGSM